MGSLPFPFTPHPPIKAYPITIKSKIKHLDTSKRAQKLKQIKRVPIAFHTCTT